MKKNKLKIIIVAIVAVIVIVTGCILIQNIGNNSDTEKTKEISYNTLAEALDGYYSRINETEDEGEKEELLNELKKYVLSDFEGYYYYHENNTYGGSNYMRNLYPESFTDEKDQRTIYVKNMDEVYILPYSKEYIEENNISVDSIDSIENNELYKYKITNIETSDKDGAYHAYKSATITLQSCYMYEKYGDTAYEDFTTIEFKFFTSDEKYDVTGFFADMISENDDVSKYKANLSSGIAYYRHYYRTHELAEEKNAENLASEAQSQTEKEKLKNSIPQVGMTPSEVEQTKWGSPDKINKDTYSWGTTEQWVYNDYGYVYFRNGKVSSVSQR